MDIDGKDSLGHEQLRGRLDAHTPQEQLDGIARRLAPAKSALRPRDKNERLPLVSGEGRATGRTFPRWLCHLLGVRHPVAHVLLVWPSPAQGDLLVLQWRALTKDDSGGHLDISVGGHMTADDYGKAGCTASGEMLEELGLSAAGLDGELLRLDGYPYDESRPDEHFYNSEFRNVYIGYLRPDAIGSVHFRDGEVAGIFLVPARDARRLLEQRIVPMASALRHTLPRCLPVLDRGPK